MITLWKEKNYKSPINIIIDRPIVEYDITKANISVLRDAGAISDNEYNYLYNADKETRSVTIGLMQGRNKSITDILNNGITSAKEKFMKLNGIDDSDVLTIRNDSITVMSDKNMILDITDRVHFRVAGVYRSFYRLSNQLELFYNYDVVNNTEILDSKGLGDSEYLHKDFMLDFLAEVFYQAQIQGIDSALNTISIFYKEYVNRSHDIGYYRELNARSFYRFDKSFSMLRGSLLTDNTSNDNKKYLDITYNIGIMNNLVALLSSVYFNKR